MNVFDVLVDADKRPIQTKQHGGCRPWTYGCGSVGVEQENYLVKVSETVWVQITHR